MEELVDTSLRPYHGGAQKSRLILATCADVKQPTLQRIEAGLRLDPSIRTIAALAAALGCSIDVLVGSTRLANDADGQFGLAGLESRMNILESRMTTVETKAASK
jgi:transcriptional regulator with XRE-family HTH domain